MHKKLISVPNENRVRKVPGDVVVHQKLISAPNENRTRRVPGGPVVQPVRLYIGIEPFFPPAFDNFGFYTDRSETRVGKRVLKVPSKGIEHVMYSRSIVRVDR